ncbi:phenylalanyl-tRNA synthetase subunit alpha [Candidatus Uzinura diaspidicola str. ASNER]|uniref:Phenylalanine--tRNA ligase alpha subunit n=1 Tax=Candidatus Uzinura diaspidicola str. ASNER TaxID=1133592 RepID=L7VN84_9FLAO|nr:phenylalanyl-tRNA synthetase subunit alpha [Candidatus Uzinura diaspidicola str. ASNER]
MQNIFFHYILYMQEKIFREIEEIRKSIQKINTKDIKEIEEFHVKYLGKKGKFSKLFKSFRKLLPYQKKQLGESINQLKKQAKEISSKLKEEKVTTFQEGILEDFTKPGISCIIGRRHPISTMKHTIINLFEAIGFITVEGPEIEDDWHNFTALNFPDHHPSRDMQDTFFIEKNPDLLLRTHTSSVQIRYMENHRPPIRILSPGRVYRNEAITARSHCMFHQIEGLYVNKGVSFTNLKQTIHYFINELFGSVRYRFRPSYFPFTEPSAEVDVYCGLESEIDRSITKGTGWLEVMGCGMVDPHVLQNVDIDPENFSGFAFGIGIERIALLLYKIEDIRFYFDNDIRFLKQF